MNGWLASIVTKWKVRDILPLNEIDAVSLKWRTCYAFIRAHEFLISVGPRAKYNKGL